MQANPPAPFPPAQAEEGALGPYLRALRAHRLLAVLIVLAALAGSIAYLALRAPEYEAESQLLVTPVAAEDETFLGLEVLRTSDDPTRTVQTAATLVDSPQAARRAAQRLGGDWTPAAVMAAVEVEPKGESNILSVTARTDDSREAARLANEFARSALAVRDQALGRQISLKLAQLEARLERLPGASLAAADVGARVDALQSIQTDGDPTLSIAQPASVPTSSAGAPSWLIVALALLAGFALASGTAIVLELLNRSVRDEEDAVTHFPLPVLARVPLVSRRESRPAPGGSWALPPPVREAFRSVLLQLGEREGDSSRTLMVTSASTGDGKSTTAVNLAVSIAAAGHEVILMDFDIRKPDVAEMLGLEEPPPLDVLVGTAASGNAGSAFSDLLVSPPGLPNMSVLATGASRAGGSALVELLDRTLLELLAEAKKHAEYVVLDTAPLGEVSDALRVAPQADDILMVVRAGGTNRANLETARDLLLRSGYVPKGFILIGDVPGVPRGYYGYGVAQREVMVGDSSPPGQAPR